VALISKKAELLEAVTRRELRPLWGCSVEMMSVTAPLVNGLQPTKPDSNPGFGTTLVVGHDGAEVVVDVEVVLEVLDVDVLEELEALEVLVEEVVEVVEAMVVVEEVEELEELEDV